MVLIRQGFNLSCAAYCRLIEFLWWNTVLYFMQENLGIPMILSHRGISHTYALITTVIPAMMYAFH